MSERDAITEPAETLVDGVAEQVTSSSSPFADETVAMSSGDYLVTLHASTPLLENPMIVEGATSERDAIDKFNAANGISGSDHRYEVTPG